MIREIILDTETTGLDPLEGHRIIEIAAIELIDHVKTEKSFHSYINPEREIPEDCNEVWICWNPTRADLHLGRCTDECYVEGDSTKYCFFDHCE